MSTTVLANVSVVAVDGRAVLIEGAPGSGKTSLALALIDRGAILIGDDGVTIECRGQLLHASPPPNTAGMAEVRNVGIIQMPVTEAALALILTLDPSAERYPLRIGKREIERVAVPTLPFAPGDSIQALRAEYALLQHGLRFPAAAQTA
ncbi:MAG: HPr kinase/phosphatase C-terminal domain-containing protein [Erythrobacter sp.]